jgi:hypothetical protein
MRKRSAVARYHSCLTHIDALQVTHALCVVHVTSEWSDKDSSDSDTHSGTDTESLMSNFVPLLYR